MSHQATAGGGTRGSRRGGRLVRALSCLGLLLTGLTAQGILALPAQAASTLSWTQVAASGSGPTARTGAGLAALSNGSVLLFGGQDANGDVGDTWLWNGSSWTLLGQVRNQIPQVGSHAATHRGPGPPGRVGPHNPPGLWKSPSPRTNPVMGYDPKTGEVILFGGENRFGVLGDTWEFDVATGTWSEPALGTVPLARADASLAWDPNDNQLEMFGGKGATSQLNDLWDWTGTTWALQSPGTGVAPTARQGAGLAYVGSGTTLILFGGNSGGVAQSDTWEWSGSGWAQNSPTQSPPARTDGLMAYDVAGQTAVLYGGNTLNSSGDSLADMWGWRPPSHADPFGSWGELAPSTTPGARGEMGGSWDPLTGSLYLFGGEDHTTSLGDLWQLHSAPAAPAAPTATVGIDQATVSWTLAGDGGSPLTSQTVTSTPDNVTVTVSGTATSANLTGLSPGATYQFGVAATNSLGTGISSGESAAVTTPGLPTVPQDVSGTPWNGTIAVSWQAPASSSYPVTSYTVTPYQGSTEGTPVSVSATTLSTTLTGLTNGEVYDVHVAAISEVGTGPSAITGSIVPATIPSAPTDLAVSAGDGQAALTWTAPDDGGSALTSYTVTPHDAAGAVLPSTTVTAPATSATILGLTDATTYTLEISATNAMGTGPSATSPDVTPIAEIRPPTDVSATPGDGDATVSWTPPTSPNLSSYVITPFIGNTAQPSTTVSAPASSAVVTGLINQDTYTFVVTAVGSNGETAASATSNAVTPADVPGAPEVTSAVPGDGSISVSWSAPTSDGGAPITGYRVQAFLGGVAQGSPVPESASTTTATLTGLTPETTYTVTVEAHNDIGWSAPGTSGPVAPYTTPGAPLDVVATPQDSAVAVSWDAPTDEGGADLTGYVLQAYEGGTAVPGATLTVAPDVTATTLSGLTNGTTYTIQVRAINAAGDGAAGISNNVTPKGIPTAPTNLVVQPDSSALYVTWGAPTSDGEGAVSGYVVTATHSGVQVTQDHVGPTTLVSLVTGLTDGTQYVITVAAVNAYGTGPVATASPTAPVAPPPPQSDAYSQLVFQSDPALYYRFDEPVGHLAQDDSGNQQNLNYGLDRVLGSGGALSLSDMSVTAGQDVPVVSGVVSGFPTNQGAGGTGNWSDEVWVRSTTDGELYDFGGTTLGTYVELSTQAGGTQIETTDGSTTWTVDAPYSLTDGHWHFIGETDAEGTLTLYVDGIAVASTTQIVVTLSSIGGSVGVGYVPGESVDEFAYYPQALTPTHFEQLFRTADGETADQGCSTGTVGFYSSQVNADGATIDYPMTDTGRSVADASNSCNSGAYGPDVSTAPSGAPSGGGMGTSGTAGAAIAYGPGTPVASAGGNWGVSAWFETTSGNNSDLLAWGDQTDPNGAQVSIQLVDNGQQISVGNGTQSVTFATPYALNAGGWNLIGVSESDGALTVEVDDQILGSAALSFDVTDAASPFVMGGHGYDGAMADVAYAPHALSGQDFVDLWSDSSGVSCAVAPTDAYGKAVVADGASEFYRMEEVGGNVAVDSSGNCLTGAYVGTPVHNTTGGPTPGSGDVAFATYLAGSSNGIASGSGPWTGAVWVNTTDTGDTVNLFGFGGQGGGHSNVSVSLSGGTGGKQLVVSSGGAAEFGGQSDGFSLPYGIEDGTWHMVDVVDDGNGNVAVYVDGQEVGEQALSMAIALPGNGLQIGGGYTGSEADFAYSPGALTGTHIDGEWLAATGTSTCPTQPTDAYGASVVQEGASVFYAMDDASGREATDISGNCQNGAYGESTTSTSGGPTPGSGYASNTGGTPMVVGSSNGIASGTGAWTGEVWVNTTDETDTANLFSFGGQGGGHSNVSVDLVGGQSGTEINVSSGGLAEYGGTNDIFTLPYGIANGTWHMVTVVGDGKGDVALFVDGQEVGEQSLAADIALPGSGLQIGGGYTGEEANFAYYSAGLTGPQIDYQWGLSESKACGTQPTNAYATAILTISPVSYYPLAETGGSVAYDASGNCENGVYGSESNVANAGPLATSAGKYDAAPKNLGAGSTLEGSAVGLASGDASRSFVLWVNTPAVTAPEAILTHGDLDSGEGFQIQLLPGRQIEVTDGSQIATFPLPYGIDDGQWHQVGVSENGTTLTLYVDGVPVGSSPMTLATQAQGYPYLIGGDTLDGLPMTGGYVAEVAAFSTALSSGQVATLWTASGHTFCGAAPTDSYGESVVNDGATLFYPMDDASGDVAKDASGDCLDGAYAVGTTTSTTGGPTSGSGFASNSGASPLVVGSSDGIASGKGAWTAGVWVKTTDVAGTANLFSFGGQGGGDSNVSAQLVGGQNGMEMNISTGGLAEYGGTNDIFTLPYGIENGTWHMVDVVGNGAGTVALYIDGQEVGEQGLPADVALPGNGLQIGGGYTGEQADFAYYPGALTGTQIDAQWTNAHSQGCGTVSTDSYTTAVLANDPAAYYPLDEASGQWAYDDVGSCTAGAYAGGTTHGAQGLLPGGSAATAGLAGVLAIASSTGLPTGSSDLTLEAWVATTEGAGTQSLVDYGNLGAGEGVALELKETDEIVLSNGVTSVSATAPSSLADGLWHQIAATDTGGTVTFYVDGVSIGAGAITLDIMSTSGPLALGGQGGGVDALQGSEASVAVYPSALTGAQIAAHALDQAHKVCGSVPGSGYGASVVADGPSEFYPMDDTGNVAIDVSGNCRNGVYAVATTTVTSGGPIPGSGYASNTGGTPMVVGSSNGIASGSGPWTAGVWVNTTDEAGTANLFSFGGQGGGDSNVSAQLLGGQNGREMNISTGSLVEFGGTDDIFTLPYGIEDGTWHMVDVVDNGNGSVALYIDGQEVGEQGLPVNVALPGNGLQIGGGYSGEQADFAYFPNALAASQIDTQWRIADPQGSCPALPTTGYAATIVNDHPSTFYELSDSGRSVTDYSGNCDTGAYAPFAIHSTQTAVRTGAGSVLGLGGDPVVVGSSMGLSSVGSIEVWEQTTNQAGTQTLFSLGGQGGGNSGLTVDMQGGTYGDTLDVISGGQDDQFSLAPGAGMADGNWHLIDVVYDGTNVTVYVDGFDAGTQSLPFALGLPGSGLQLGAGFTGNLDDFALDPYDLTYYQAVAHYNARENPSCGANAIQPYGGTVLANKPATFLQFAEAAGPEANDASGHCTPGSYEDDVVHAPSGGPGGGSYITSSGGGGALVLEGAPVMTAGGPWTVEMWVATAPGSSANFTLWNDGSVNVAVAAGSIALTSAQTSLTGASGYLINDGSWHLVTIRYGNPGVEIAIDGQVVAENTAGTLPDATSGYAIGTGIPQGDGLANFAVYPSALSSGDIDQRWEVTHTGSPCVAGQGPTNDPYGYQSVLNKGAPDVNFPLNDATPAVQDASGNCHTAAYDPNVTFGAGDAGLFTYASAQYRNAQGQSESAPVIAVASDNDLPSGASPLTIEALVQVASTNPGGVIAQWGTPGVGGVSFALNGNQQLLLTTSGPNAHTVSLNISKPLVPNITNALAVSVDASGNVKFYVNGYELAPNQGSATTISLDTVTPGAGLYIGGNGGQGFQGDIGDVAIDSQALSPSTLEGQFGYAQAQVQAQMAAENPSQSPTSSCGCDPVNTQSGTYTAAATDEAISGLGPGLNLSRSYASSNGAQNSPFGYGWGFSYGMSLDVNTAAGTAVVTQEDGSQVGFYQTSSGAWLAPAEDFATLTLNPDGTYTFLRRATQIFTFSASGQLTSISDMEGDATTLQYSVSGKLASVTDASGRELSFTWTGNNITSVTDPLGRVISYGYDAAGDLTSVTGVNGGTVTYTYDATHQMLTLRDADGHTVTNVYNAGGQVTSQTDGAGHTTGITYGTNASGGEETTLTSPMGSVTVDNYNSEGEQTSTTTGAGTSVQATTTYTYDPQREPTAMTNPDGGVTRYTYDSNGSITSQTTPLGETTTTTYNAYDEPLTLTNPLGVTSTYTYNGDGTIASESTPNGTGGVVTQTFSYDNPSLPSELTSVSNPQGQTTNYGYDAYGDLTSVTDPLGNETTYTYDQVGRVTSETSPNGNVSGANPAANTTTWSYDALGRTVTQTAPGGASTTALYDANGQPISETDPNGNTTTLSYNGDDEPTTETLPDGTTRVEGYNADGEVISTFNGVRSTTSAYDPRGDLISQTTANGDTTSYTYDLAGKRTSVTTPLGQTTQMVYDANGRPIETILPNGATDTTAYDAKGQVTSTTDGNGNTSSMTYNDQGQLLSSTNALHQTTSNTYDGAGHLVSTKDPKGAISSATYDANGNELTSTDPVGNVTTYAYNAKDELTHETTPLSEATSYSYDQNGNLTSTTDPNGVTTSMSYTTLNQVSGISYSDGTPSVGYSYNADGSVTSMTDGTGTTSYSYDTNGQLSQETNGAGNSIGYSYNSNGELATETYPQAGGSTPHTVSYGYNALGEETSVADWLGNATTFSYDASGNWVSQNLPNGISTASSYDAANHLTGMVATLGSGSTQSTVLGLSYSRDAVGAITGETDSGSGAGTDSGQTYSYDANHQIASVSGAPYSFDKAGNITSMPTPQTLGGGTSAFAYNANSELTSTTVTGGSVDGTTTYSYDGSGNRTAAIPGDGTAATTYGYNAAHELTGVSTPTLPPGTGGAQGNETYSYNGNGQRQSVTLNGVTSQETWDAAGNVVDDGTNQYVYGPGGAAIEEIGSEGNDTSPFYFLEDANGSTRTLTDSSGNVVGTYAYDAYGNVTQHTGVSTPLQFDGEYADATGLLYDQARFYDPTTGSFITVDPLLGITGQAYAFANGNPINQTDPSGMGSWNPLTGGMGAQLASTVASDFSYVTCEAKAHVGEAVQTALPIAAGIVAGGLCEATLGAVTGGVGSAACVEAGFIVSGAVGGWLNCPASQSRASCALDGGVAGAMSGAVFIATDGAGVVVQGMLSGFEDSVIDQQLSTGTVNWGQAAESAVIGGALGGATKGVMGMFSGAAGAAVGGTAAEGTASAAVEETTVAAEESSSNPVISCVTNSFTGSTPVVMANGSLEPISQISVGSKVEATDPTTGKTVDATVSHIFKNNDHALANVTVKGKDGATATLETTQGHRFWDVTEHAWVFADALRPGDELLSDNGQDVTVVLVQDWAGSQTMFDLTVNGVHTFYVAVGESTALVHNCGEPILGSNGTQVISKTLHQTSGFHIDVENPAPSVRAGQLHLQDYSGAKYLYNFETGAFEGLPPALAKEVAADPGVGRAIATGARYLGVAT